jgi:putative flippase GtrA
MSAEGDAVRERRTGEDEDTSRESGKETGVKYAQFSLIGGSNALVDLGVLNLLLLVWPTRSSEILVVFNIAALALTNANSYLWNTLWTFRHQARHDARQVGLFTAQGVLNVSVGALLLWLLAHWLVAHTDLSPLAGGNVAKVVSMAGASTLSFVLLRYFVFRKSKR